MWGMATTTRAAPSHSQPTFLRSGTNRRPRTGDLLLNVTTLAGLWFAYAAVRGLTGGDYATAGTNAASIIDFQRAIGLPAEAAVQALALEQTWLIKAANYYYIGVHFPATALFVGVVWYRHRWHFDRIRTVLIAVTGAGLVLHLMFPLKPPRMIPGFIDTAKSIGPDPYAIGLSEGANQLAAMPSLHVGWALLVAVGVVWIYDHPGRWLVMAHPALTVAVVVVTANHYWLDAIIAAALVLACWRLTSPGGHGTARGADARVALKAEPDQTSAAVARSGP